MALRGGGGVCVMTVAPWTPANVMSVGFLKAGSLSCVLRKPLRRVTFTTTGASGAGHPFKVIHSQPDSMAHAPVCCCTVTTTIYGEIFKGFLILITSERI